MHSTGPHDKALELQKEPGVVLTQGLRAGDLTSSLLAV